MLASEEPIAGSKDPLKRRLDAEKNMDLMQTLKKLHHADGNTSVLQTGFDNVKLTFFDKCVRHPFSNLLGGNIPVIMVSDSTEDGNDSDLIQMKCIHTPITNIHESVNYNEITNSELTFNVGLYPLSLDNYHTLINIGTQEFKKHGNKKIDESFSPKYSWIKDINDNPITIDYARAILSKISSIPLLSLPYNSYNAVSSPNLSTRRDYIVNASDVFLCRTVGNEHSVDGLTGYLGSMKMQIIDNNKKDDIIKKTDYNVIIQLSDMGLFEINAINLPSVMQVLADATLMIIPDELFKQQHQQMLQNSNSNNENISYPDPHQLLSCTCVSEYIFLRDFLSTEGSIENSIIENGNNYFYNDDNDDNERIPKKQKSEYNRIEKNNEMNNFDQSFNDSILLESIDSSFFKNILKYCGGTIFDNLLSGIKNTDGKRSLLFSINRNDSNLDTINLAIEFGIELNIENINKDKEMNKDLIAENMAEYFERYSPKSSISVEMIWNGFPSSLLSKPPLSSNLNININIYPGDVDPQNHTITKQLLIHLKTISSLFYQLEIKNQNIFSTKLRELYYNLNDLFKNINIKLDEIDWNNEEFEELQIVDNDTYGILNRELLDYINLPLHNSDMIENEELKLLCNDIDNELLNLTNNKFNPVSYIIPKLDFLNQDSIEQIYKNNHFDVINRNDLDFTEKLIFFIQRTVFGFSKHSVSINRLKKLELLFNKYINYIEDNKNQCIKDNDKLEKIVSIFNKCYLIRQFYRTEAFKLERLIKTRIQLIFKRLYILLSNNESFQPIISRNNNTPLANGIREYYRLRSQRTSLDKNELKEYLQSMFQYWCNESTLQVILETLQFKLKRDYFYHFNKLKICSKSDIEEWISINDKLNSNNDNIFEKEILILNKLHHSIEICYLIKQNMINIPIIVLTSLVSDIIKNNSNYDHSSKKSIRYKISTRRFSNEISQNLIKTISDSPFGCQNWTMYLKPNSITPISVINNYNNDENNIENNKNGTEYLNFNKDIIKGRYMIMLEQIEDNKLNNQNIFEKNVNRNQNKKDINEINELSFIDGKYSSSFLSVNKSVIYDTEMKKMKIVNSIVDSSNSAKNNNESENNNGNSNLQLNNYKYRMIKGWTTIASST